MSVPYGKLGPSGGTAVRGRIHDHWADTLPVR